MIKTFTVPAKTFLQYGVFHIKTDDNINYMSSQSHDGNKNLLETGTPQLQVNQDKSCI